MRLSSSISTIVGGLEPRLGSSSINAQHQLTAAGAGITVLPCFIADPGARLRRILPHINIRRTFWLAAHQDIVDTPRTQAFMDWLIKFIAEEQELLSDGLLQAGPH